MKAIWKGALSFGLVNIPVNVYPASEERTLDFHMLHKKDHSPIRFARICKEEDKEIPYSEIVKGYEYEKGEYVIIDENDFAAARSKKSETIDIEYFTDVSEINPVYYEKPYFLEPSKKAGKAYQLLFEALKQSNKIGIANYVFRNRGHVGAILCSNKGLILIQMRYTSELRSNEELQLPESKSSPKELKLAYSLIDQLSQPFDPEKHHDTYTEDLLKVIDQKAKGGGKKRTSLKKEKARPEIHDLMGLLKESLQTPGSKRVGRKHA